MKPRIYISEPVAVEVEQYLAEHCEYRKWEGKLPITRPELFENLHDADGLLIHGVKIDAELLSYAPRLKVVSNLSAGYNNFDLNLMWERGIMGTNTPEVLDKTVADLVFGLILSAARRIPELDRQVKEGKWTREIDDSCWGVDVHSSTLGIIGLGRIGEEVARRGKFGFNMDVLYYSRTQKVEAEARLGMTYCSLEALLAKSDFVVLIIPLTPETVKMIGKEQFAMMKKTAIFINGSRGSIVDEAALIEAVQTGKIRAAGLDVYEQEPLSHDSPLLQMANVVTIPHIGSATAQTRGKMAMLAAHNAIDALNGRRPSCLVKELQSLML